MQTALDGAPKFWVVPPPRVFAADLGDTLVNGILAGVGAYLFSGGVSYITTHQIDMATCVSWSAIVGGSVVMLPIAGDALAEVMGDISQAVAEGWNRGQPEPDKPEAEPVPLPEPTEDEAGAARVPGAWWYYDARKQLKCYHTPVGQARGTERPKPIISDARMVRIFAEVEQGTAFSERAMCAKVAGLSGSQFRRLQDDWCNLNRGPLYIIRPDRSGYFTPAGKRIAEAIRTAEL